MNIIILALCLFLVLLGFLGLFFYKDNVKRIASLMLSYVSFMGFLLYSSFYMGLDFDLLLLILVVVLLIFALNLYVLSAIFIRLSGKG